MFFQRHLLQGQYSHPSSKELLTSLSPGSGGVPQSLHPISGLGDELKELEEQMDSNAISRYLQARGHGKRHTVAMGSEEEVQDTQWKMQPRQRRSGLLTVMEKQPVPRRASDGCPSVSPHRTQLERIYNQTVGAESKCIIKALQQECHQLQKHCGGTMDAQLHAEIQRRHSLHVQQMAHLQPCLLASSVSSPPSIAGSPIHQSPCCSSGGGSTGGGASPCHGTAPASPAAALSQHLQRLHLQRRGSPVGFCLDPADSPPLEAGSPGVQPVGSPQAPSPPPYPDFPRLQSLVAPPLRNSPPPIFPNLGMIREDAVENGTGLVRPEIVVSPAYGPACWGFPPQISVTDERGKEVLTSSSSTSPSSCSSAYADAASLLPLDLAYSPVRWQATLEEALAWPRGLSSPSPRSPAEGSALQKSPSGSLCLVVAAGPVACGDLLRDIRRRLDAHAPRLPLVLQPSERGLALEHPAAGVQIELEVCDGPRPDERGLKMRRISGDSLQYSQLCHQLVACMNM